MQYYATKDAPDAIGPYSQAVSLNSILMTSGQIPLDPQTGEIVSGDFDAMTRRVFDNLAAVLAEAGASFSDVIKANVFMTDLGQFQQLNAIYAEYFGAHKPARSTVQVAALPKGAPVEIDLMAIIPG